MLIMAILCAWASAHAQGSSFLIDIQHRQLPLACERRSLYLANPGSMWHLDSLSLADFSASFDHLDNKVPEIEQDGTGHTAFVVEAKAYKRLSAKSVAWGSAQFATATRRSIRWADCIDYDYVAPYVLGDPVGGDLQTNRYQFRGGYATQTSVCTLGAQVDYRAEIAYRNVDPRIKAIVSDLKAKVGATRAFGKHWLAGMSAAINRYDQNCDIDFYNPLNDINTFPLTGLGSWYQRFTGNANKGSSHEAIGWSIGAQAIKLRGGGINLTYQKYRMHQRLQNFNNLMLAYADNDILTVNACYALRPAGSIAFMPTLTYALRHRQGTENLFGQAVGSSYDKIGSRHNYSQCRACVDARCHLQVNAGGGYMTITPGFVYLSDHESLVESNIKKNSHTTEATVNVTFSRTSGKWLWQTITGGALSAHKPAASVGISAGRLIGSILFQAEAGWQGCDGRNQAFASISLLF